MYVDFGIHGGRKTKMDIQKAYEDDHYLALVCFKGKIQHLKFKTALFKEKVSIIISNTNF